MVRKFRKKPVVIDAILWNGKNFMEVKAFAGLAVKMEEMSSGGKAIVVTTLETERELNTVHAAAVGDYIIKGIKGEFYPCKPDIFEETYEKVTS